MKNNSQYYCFECKYAKSLKGVLHCSVYRGGIDPTNKACLDFELKENFIRRKPKAKKKKIKK